MTFISSRSQILSYIELSGTAMTLTLRDPHEIDQYIALGFSVNDLRVFKAACQWCLVNFRVISL